MHVLVCNESLVRVSTLVSEGIGVLVGAEPGVVAAGFDGCLAAP